MAHEIQISSKPVAIANTENHVITDRSKSPVSNDWIYTAIFQQYISGVATIVTWVWADIDFNIAKHNPKDDLLGNIYSRPGNQTAHARVTLDGMRLAPELRKFMQYQPEIALLYAPSSILLEGKSYLAALQEIYMALCFTGYRPRMITEQQLAAKDFGETKVVFAVGAKYISQSALNGFAEFVRRGGRVITDSKSLLNDEFGQSVKCSFVTEKLCAVESETLLMLIKKNITPLPVMLKCAHGEGNKGVFFRMIPDTDGSWLVNIVNYNKELRSLELIGNGNWYDLIREENFKSKFDLQPLKPLLLRFIPNMK